MRPARNARVGPLVEAVPITTAPRIHYSPTDLLTLLILRPAWAYRVELLLLTLASAAWIGLTHFLSGTITGILLVVLAAALVLLPPTRELLLGLLVRARLRRQWTRACRHANLATGNDRVPVIRSITTIPAGERLHVRVPAGSHPGDLDAAADPIAAFLEARNVRVTRDPDNARYAHVTVVRHDPLAAPLADPWPWLRAGRLDLWTAAIPVGIDEHGELVTLNLTEKNVLLGGEPGAGKSVGASMLLAAAALDPRVRLILCDGALVELAPWRRVADTFIGPDPAAFLEVLSDLRDELGRRLDKLLAAGRRKVSPGDGLPLLVVVIDELAFYLNTGDRKRDEQIASALRDLVARGRKTGIIVIAATQRPSHDVVPTSIRDLFAYRWAFRCTTPEASDTILGRGHASLGYSAADIPADQRGVGWLRAEGTEPRRLRTYYLTDEHLNELADHAHRQRELTTGPTGRLRADLHRLDHDDQDHDGDPDTSTEGAA